MIRRALITAAAALVILGGGAGIATATEEPTTTTTTEPPATTTTSVVLIPTQPEEPEYTVYECATVLGAVGEVTIPAIPGVVYSFEDVVLDSGTPYVVGPGTITIVAEPGADYIFPDGEEEVLYTEIVLELPPCDGEPSDDSDAVPLPGPPAPARPIVAEPEFTG
jgi:hypothetical protein